MSFCCSTIIILLIESPYGSELKQEPLELILTYDINVPAAIESNSLRSLSSFFFQFVEPFSELSRSQQSEQRKRARWRSKCCLLGCLVNAVSYGRKQDVTHFNIKEVCPFDIFSKRSIGNPPLTNTNRFDFKLRKTGSVDIII